MSSGLSDQLSAVGKVVPSRLGRWRYDIRPTLAALLCLSLWLTPFVYADEGMIPMSELAKVDLRARGLELTAEQLFNPQAISLVDGVCRVNGCTGSFVSKTGLIITNHHCAYGAIQQASTTEHDYLRNGFTANSLAEEIPAPDYTVRVTEDYRDVSQEVLQAVNDGMSYAERTRAIEKRCKELELAAEQAQPSLRAEVAEMFAGKSYVLFLFTYLKDIRLSFAPPASIGNFGGEDDNWMWPRHTGDFSFMRAYTAPDGSSATYAKENIPYRPKRFVQVSSQGVEEGDAVFLLGYPGRTARHKTTSFLEYENDVRLPLIVDLYQWQMELLTQAGREDRSVEIKLASRIRSLANVEKRSRGQLKGIQRAAIIAKRQAEEDRLQAFIDADDDRRAKYGDLLPQIDAVYNEMRAQAPWEINLEQLRSACQALRAGFFVIDAANERSKADIDREPQYMERNWEQSLQQLKAALSDYHAPSDKLLLSGLLERLSQTPQARDNPALAGMLRQPTTLPATAQRLIDGTQLGQWKFVEQCLQQSSTELAASKDPMLQFVLALYPSFLALREVEKEREGRLDPLYGLLIEVKQQLFNDSFMPDANATLRLTSGRIRSYSPADAVIMSPISTLTGVIEKTTGTEPFITPEKVLSKYREKDFGIFRDPHLNDVPVAILYDTDTTGGNSGSPVFNARGELVGVNFDRCFEATINDFAWDQSTSRSIGVDMRYVLWITGVVYEADQLLQEMGVATP